MPARNIRDRRLRRQIGSLGCRKDEERTGMFPIRIGRVSLCPMRFRQMGRRDRRDLAKRELFELLSSSKIDSHTE